MHGLVNKALQSFFCATYGTERWLRVTEAAGFESPEFEAMLIYDKDQSSRLLDAMALELERPLNEVLEDIGTFLVSNPHTESLRRLLRFCGVSYLDFLHSLDDLPDRARLAVSDLHLPALELREHAAGRFSLTCAPGLPGFGDVLVGVLRAMADDYGALAMLEHSGGTNGRDVISITLIETAFAKGRSFELGATTP
ncbi:heme NO-binding domain-containing protein [Sedimentitalea sp.]|uniref:heme NO-binding domain-containing protein n=1 Tax=Sedimentitalea sp. TaxID=2048915 RepID=UPI003298CB84